MENMDISNFKKHSNNAENFVVLIQFLCLRNFSVSTSQFHNIASNSKDFQRRNRISSFAILRDKIKFLQLLRDSKLAQARVRCYTKSVN